MRIIQDVTNTYLVFRKIKYEFDYMFDYSNDISLNNVLTDELRRICQKNYIHSENIITLKEYKDFKICQEHFYSDKLERGFNLLLIEHMHDRILLNYIDDRLNFNPVEDFLITEDFELEDFSLKCRIMGKDYIIYNTFDSFIEYSRANALELNRVNNKCFFNNINSGLEISNTPIESGKIYNLTYLPHNYKFMVFDNYILIIDYKKEINDTDDLPF